MKTDYKHYDRDHLISLLERRDVRIKELACRFETLKGIEVDRDRWKELAMDLRKKLDSLKDVHKKLLLDSLPPEAERGESESVW